MLTDQKTFLNEPLRIFFVKERFISLCLKLQDKNLKPIEADKAVKKIKAHLNASIDPNIQKLSEYKVTQSDDLKNILDANRKTLASISSAKQQDREAMELLQIIYDFEVVVSLIAILDPASKAAVMKHVLNYIKLQACDIAFNLNLIAAVYHRCKDFMPARAVIKDENIVAFTDLLNKQIAVWNLSVLNHLKLRATALLEKTKENSKHNVEAFLLIVNDPKKDPYTKLKEAEFYLSNVHIFKSQIKKVSSDISPQNKNQKDDVTKPDLI